MKLTAYQPTDKEAKPDNATGKGRTSSSSSSSSEGSDSSTKNVPVKHKEKSKSSESEADDKRRKSSSSSESSSTSESGGESGEPLKPIVAEDFVPSKCFQALPDGDGQVRVQLSKPGSDSPAQVVPVKHGKKSELSERESDDEKRPRRKHSTSSSSSSSSATESEGESGEHCKPIIAEDFVPSKCFEALPDRDDLIFAGRKDNSEDDGRSGQSSSEPEVGEKFGIPKLIEALPIKLKQDKHQSDTSSSSNESDKEDMAERAEKQPAHGNFGVHEDIRPSTRDMQLAQPVLKAASDSYSSSSSDSSANEDDDRHPILIETLLEKPPLVLKKPPSVMKKPVSGHAGSRLIQKQVSDSHSSSSSDSDSSSNKDDEKSPVLKESLLDKPPLVLKKPPPVMKKPAHRPPLTAVSKPALGPALDLHSSTSSDSDSSSSEDDEKHPKASPIDEPAVVPSTVKEPVPDLRLDRFSKQSSDSSSSSSSDSDSSSNKDDEKSPVVKETLLDKSPLVLKKPPPVMKKPVRGPPVIPDSKPASDLRSSTSSNSDSSSSENEEKHWKKSLIEEPQVVPSFVKEPIPDLRLDHYSKQSSDSSSSTTSSDSDSSANKDDKKSPTIKELLLDKPPVVVTDSKHMLKPVSDSHSSTSSDSDSSTSKDEKKLPILIESLPDKPPAVLKKPPQVMKKPVLGPSVDPGSKPVRGNVANKWLQNIKKDDPKKGVESTPQKAKPKGFKDILAMFQKEPKPDPVKVSKPPIPDSKPTMKSKTSSSSSSDSDSSTEKNVHVPKLATTKDQDKVSPKKDPRKSSSSSSSHDDILVDKEKDVSEDDVSGRYNIPSPVMMEDIVPSKCFEVLPGGELSLLIKSDTPSDDGDDSNGDEDDDELKSDLRKPSHGDKKIKLRKNRSSSSSSSSDDGKKRRLRKSRSSSSSSSSGPKRLSTGRKSKTPNTKDTSSNDQPKERQRKTKPSSSSSDSEMSNRVQWPKTDLKISTSSDDNVKKLLRKTSSISSSSSESETLKEDHPLQPGQRVPWKPRERSSSSTSSKSAVEDHATKRVIKRPSIRKQSGFDEKEDSEPLVIEDFVPSKCIDMLSDDELPANDTVREKPLPKSQSSSSSGSDKASKLRVPKHSSSSSSGSERHKRKRPLRKPGSLGYRSSGSDSKAPSRPLRKSRTSSSDTSGSDTRQPSKLKKPSRPFRKSRSSSSSASSKLESAGESTKPPSVDKRPRRTSSSSDENKSDEGLLKGELDDRQDSDQIILEDFVPSKYIEIISDEELPRKSGQKNVIDRPGSNPLIVEEFVPAKYIEIIPDDDKKEASSDDSEKSSPNSSSSESDDARGTSQPIPIPEASVKPRRHSISSSNSDSVSDSDTSKPVIQDPAKRDPGKSSSNSDESESEDKKDSDPPIVPSRNLETFSELPTNPSQANNIVDVSRLGRSQSTSSYNRTIPSDDEFSNLQKSRSSSSSSFTDLLFNKPPAVPKKPLVRKGSARGPLADCWLQSADDPQKPFDGRSSHLNSNIRKPSMSSERGSPTSSEDDKDISKPDARRSSDEEVFQKIADLVKCGLSDQNLDDDDSEEKLPTEVVVFEEFVPSKYIEVVPDIDTANSSDHGDASGNGLSRSDSDSSASSRKSLDTVIIQEFVPSKCITASPDTNADIKDGKRSDQDKTSDSSTSSGRSRSNSSTSSNSSNSVEAIIIEAFVPSKHCEVLPYVDHKIKIPDHEDTSDYDSSGSHDSDEKNKIPDAIIIEAFVPSKYHEALPEAPPDQKPSPGKSIIKPALPAKPISGQMENTDQQRNNVASTKTQFVPPEVAPKPLPHTRAGQQWMSQTKKNNPPDRQSTVIPKRSKNLKELAAMFESGPKSEPPRKPVIMSKPGRHSLELPTNSEPINPPRVQRRSWDEKGISYSNEPSTKEDTNEAVLQRVEEHKNEVKNIGTSEKDKDSSSDEETSSKSSSSDTNSSDFEPDTGVKQEAPGIVDVTSNNLHLPTVDTTERLDIPGNHSPARSLTEFTATFELLSKDDDNKFESECAPDLNSDTKPTNKSLSSSDSDLPKDSSNKPKKLNTEENETKILPSIQTAVFAENISPKATTPEQSSSKFDKESKPYDSDVTFQPIISTPVSTQPSLFRDSPEMSLYPKRRTRGFKDLAAMYSYEDDDFSPRTERVKEVEPEIKPATQKPEMQEITPSQMTQQNALDDENRRLSRNLKELAAIYTNESPNDRENETRGQNTYESDAMPKVAVSFDTTNEMPFQPMPSEWKRPDTFRSDESRASTSSVNSEEVWNILRNFREELGDSSSAENVLDNEESSDALDMNKPLVMRTTPGGTELSVPSNESDDSSESSQSGEYEIKANPSFLSVNNPYAIKEEEEEDQGEDTSADETESVEIKDLSFTVKPEDRTTDLGGFARFGAFVIGKPNPEINWIKDGKNADDDPDTTKIVDKTGYTSLIITDVNKSHVGKYTCEATNSRGKISASAELRLESSK